MFGLVFVAMMAMDLPPTVQVAMVDRQVSQEKNTWFVRYQLQWLGTSPVTLTADEITTSYEAWVSNSSCKPHGVARKSCISFNLAKGNRALTTVIASPDERQKCKECITFYVAVSDQPPQLTIDPKTDFLPVTFQPQQIFWLCLSIEHLHFLYGKYDVLLGRREISVNFGFAKFSDVLELNAECNASDVSEELGKPRQERLDDSQFHSPPDSLLITTEINGFQFFRFGDVPVRYNTKFKLGFWYLIAHGSDGECRVRLMQYQEADSLWRKLDNILDEQLEISSKWRYFEKICTTGRETNTIALDFRIILTNEATLWVDDVRLTPIRQRMQSP